MNGVMLGGNDDNNESKILDYNSIGNNFPGTYYSGPNNPKNNDGTYNYSLRPRNLSDAIARKHDIDYDQYYAKGASALLLERSVVLADEQFVKAQTEVFISYFSQYGLGINKIDPYTGNFISFRTALTALFTGSTIGLTTSFKSILYKY